jgi:curli production assembly/transport component CsgG/holdfast attachment protein HfaB
MVACLVAAGLTGCSISTAPDPSGLYATPVGGAPVIDNATPYTRALMCLRDEIAGQAVPRIAIGEIGDFTGKYDEYSGHKVTQGAALMAVSAFSMLGLPLVERLDMRVAETELRLANNNLVSEDGELRLIAAGSLPGSDLYLVGGITELNYNIGSVAADLFFDQGGISGQFYVINIALDLRLVKTTTLEVVDTVSYQKQILGREVRAGVFEFFDDALFDVSLSERALEPIQLAVRAMIEKAVGEMARRQFGLSADTCAPALREGHDAPSNNQERLP